jgi:hypothetical protein
LNLAPSVAVPSTENHGEGARVERMNHSGDEPQLRIAGYVPGHAEAAMDPRGRPANVPDIADYWPDSPRRRQAAGEARRAAERQAAARAKQPMPPPRPVPGGTPPTAGNPPNRRPVLLAGLLALVAVGGTVLLVRPLIHEEKQPPPPVVAAPPPAAAESAIPLPTPSVSIAPTTTTPPPSAATSAPPSPAPAVPPSEAAPVIKAARFELVSGVTELSVRTRSLDGDAFRVRAADDSGLRVETTFSDGVLRVSAKSDGDGSGKLNVQLSDEIVWHLRLSAGVAVGAFDMNTGTVSRIDLDGGAERFEVSLGRLADTLPIRMTGGVATWRIETAQRVPVRVRVGNGAGDVSLYGDSSGGVGDGKTIRSGDFDDRAGLDINAEAGMGSLEVSRD